MRKQRLPATVTSFFMRIYGKFGMIMRGLLPWKCRVLRLSRNLEGRGVRGHRCCVYCCRMFWKRLNQKRLRHCGRHQKIEKSLRASYSGGLSLDTVLECQPHLMPRHIPMRGLVGHAFVHESEFGVVVDEPVLAGQD